ncbi:hypothetical protein Clacol_002417 [Clathrus columnatus]|uniref:TPR-like protein n=1 Tax=Clathrus columnatus TaxID=1419009 RepID=A0AAV5A4R0_9AGAM|nr:hypothetical protein Clacol_002417 [Clathrus columnatus]
MGRTKTKKIPRSSTAAQRKAEGSTTPAKESPSIPSLFTKAQQLVTQCNYDLALKFLERILQQDAHFTNARELLGEVQLEIGEIETAKQVDSTFESLLPPSPFAPTAPSANAHLNLAQLQEDPRQCLAHYQVGVDALVGQLKGKEPATVNDEQDDEVKTKIVGALAAMVEIWMSDLCFEDEAESSSEKLASLALEIDPTSCEAMQTLASVRMSQKRSEEARQLAERAWERWKDLDPESPKLPPLPVRLSLVRLFLELSLYSNALTILSGVIGLDDQDVEAWYLEGWCFYLMAEQARETSALVEGLSYEELARDAMDCLQTCQMLHQAQEHPDEQILQHAKEISAELSAAGIEATPDDPDQDVNDDDNDDAWEDDEGDVEMD